VGGGWWAASLVWFGYTARPPPPVILPGAAFAALCLAGALRRASPFRLALPPAVLWMVATVPRFCTTGYEWRGAEKRRDGGRSRRRKCQSARQQPPQIGARAEARLAWSPPSSPTDQICKPSRSTQARVAPFSAPRYEAWAAALATSLPSSSSGVRQVLGGSRVGTHSRPPRAGPSAMGAPRRPAVAACPLLVRFPR